MALNIIIQYPEPSEIVSAEQLSVLASFEEMIKEKILSITGSTSNYRWQHVPEHQSDNYFLLIKNFDDKVLGTYGMRWLTHVPPEEFMEKVKMDVLFPDRE